MLDILDILGYIGLGGVIGAMMLGICFNLSRRPTQTMLVGENVIKRSEDDAVKSKKKANDTEKETLVEPEDDSRSAEKAGSPSEPLTGWGMTFHVVKRHAYGDWSKALNYAIVETIIIATFLYLIFPRFNLFKAIGLGALTGAGLYLVFFIIRIVVGKKLEISENGRKIQFMIFTFIACALNGAAITYLLCDWTWLNNLLYDLFASVE